MRSVVRVLALSALVVAVATPASASEEPVVVVNDPPGTEYAQDWDSPPERKRGGKDDDVTAQWSIGVCRGSFSTLIQNVGSVQFGAYWQCTSSVQTTIRATIQQCTRYADGSYFCDPYSERYGPLANSVAYFNRSDAYFPCIAGQGYYYRPIARNMTVKECP